MGYTIVLVILRMMRLLLLLLLVGKLFLQLSHLLETQWKLLEMVMTWGIEESCLSVVPGNSVLLPNNLML